MAEKEIKLLLRGPSSDHCYRQCYVLNCVQIKCYIKRTLLFVSKH